LKKIFVSVGDLNGIGIEIALRSHKFARSLGEIAYSVSVENARNAARLLDLELPGDFNCVGSEPRAAIKAGQISAESGAASFASFKKAVELAVEQNGLRNGIQGGAIVTLPISKAAWALSGIVYKGHTDYLRGRFGGASGKAMGGVIMALGCNRRFAALFTDHIPLRDVAAAVKFDEFFEFLTRLAKLVSARPIGVLGLNPHAGDYGAIGDEELEIERAIAAANRALGENVFEGTIVPDAAWTPKFLARYKWIAAIYHDQALAPLKALFFDEAINVSLGLPIFRASVDHGTAFDIAYQGANPSRKSYENALLAAANGVYF
jgi:4-hydroxythreonine-4-phosphate dehydrogenase